MDSKPFIFGYAYDNTADVLNQFITETGNEQLIWYHFDRNREQIDDLLNDQKLPSLIRKNLMSEDTRPTVKTFPEGQLITLRCINYYSNESAEEMVALHLWVSDRKVISVRSVRTVAVDDLVRDIENGVAISTPAELLSELIRSINKHIEQKVYDIEDAIDELEENLMASSTMDIRSTLASLRRKIIAIRRYIIPQRDVLSLVMNLKELNLDDSGRWQLRDSYEKLIRIIEDLDLIRDRASLIHDEVNNRMAENMNKTMFMLSIVATIFLPLSFLTGLLGINVGGLPGLNNPYAFTFVCILCVILFLFEIAFFKARKMF